MENKSISDLDKLKDNIKVGERVTDVNILFLDISTSCTGYSIAKINFEKKTVEWKKAGVLWLPTKGDNQDKFCYMYNAIVNYFWIVEQIDYIVAEEYRLNPKKLHGAQVVVEMHGVIKAAAGENGVRVDTILPQTWRSQLGIKGVPNVKKTGKDYKQPTMDKVSEYLTLPLKSTSNITNNERKTPDDLADAIAIGLGWCKKFGLDQWEFNTVEYNTHIGVVNE